MSKAERIGNDILANAALWRAIQRHLGLQDDAWPGDATVTSIATALGVNVPSREPSKFPNEDYASMVAYYGRPGDESNLVRCRFPYPMRLYTRSAPANVTSHRCHRKVRDSLEAVLTDLLETYGRDWITEHGLDVFGGIYNDRSIRGGSHAKSKHAWGVAIDLNPAENGLHTPWPSRATMPVEAIETFERHGWKSLARVIGRDAMHFEATS